MSFMAFLIFGSGLGVVFAYVYPAKSSKRAGFMQKVAYPALLGVLGTFFVSVLGQSLGFFKSGQMLEWLSAILLVSVLVFLYKLATR